MLALPRDSVRGTLVQLKPEWRSTPPVTCSLVSPTCRQNDCFVSVNDETSDTLEDFCCQELGLGIGVVGLHQDWRAHLHSRAEWQRGKHQKLQCARTVANRAVLP